MIAGSDEWAERRQRIEAAKAAAALMRDLVKREQSRHTYLVELCGHVCPVCGGCPGCCCTGAADWAPLPAPFSKYEVYAHGFGPDQRPVRRIGGVALATTVSKHGGYLMVKPYDDDGNRPTKTVHSLVLLGFAGERKPGQESRHLDDDPLNNRWRPGTDEEAVAAGGNLVYGSKPQNAADKYRNGGQAPVPKAHKCANHARCGGMVANEGSRCLPCVEVVGERAAVMLNAGLSLDDVTTRLDYRNAEWVWKLAVRYGGYAGSLPHARAQQPPKSRRVTTTLRAIFRIGLRDGS